ncbi:MAG: hypothetical protein EPO21_22710 [Chloroflexota bacterium]|nr:MAG: hypothetical protein EPO21_22710 [Chloroflexota bacterium]
MAATIRPRREACNLGPIARIPLGEGRTFQIGGVSVAVFHTRQHKVFATQGACPHCAAPLADGIVGAGKVVCPFHGCRFDLATGEPVGSACRPLETYPVFLSETGDILLSEIHSLCGTVR